MNGVQDTKRIVFAQNITNFRDLGGCPVQDERRVKPGRFYRSSVLSKLQQEDLDLLTNLKIQMILDLRSPSEVRSEPDVMLPGCQYYNYSGINLGEEYGASSENDIETNMDMRSILTAIVEKKIQLPDSAEFYTAQYEAMAVDSSAFRQMFHLIKESPKAPILFHCAAGKDRTGVAAALILLCLGATEETAMEDYMLSNIHRREENDQAIRELSALTQDRDLLVSLRVMLGVEESFLRTFFTKVHELYGGWDSYFEQALCLSPSERAQMRERYLI